MRVTPISKQEAEAGGFALWPAGDYDFEVREAHEAQSKAGSDMIALQLWIFNPEGRRRVVFDYLVEGEKTRWKVRRFAEACGVIRDYEAGNLDPDSLVGRAGRCAVGQQGARDGYEARNTVRDYLPGKQVSKDKSPSTDLDDEIPF